MNKEKIKKNKKKINHNIVCMYWDVMFWIVSRS